MMRPGPRNLITDVPGLKVGNAADARLKSGVTVLTADAPFVAGVDIRGGAPGTRETDLLAPGRLVGAVDALVLAGGSAFGLDAASGVQDRLRALGRGHRAGALIVPIVPAAILFDLANGRDKGWEANPYPALGAAAFDAAAAEFALGSEGAGTGAMTATLMGGLGSASLVTEEGTTVGALAAVNAFGSVCVPGGRAFWAGAFEIGDEFGGLGASARRVPPFTPRPMKPGPDDPAANTTIAIVATDAALDKAGARRLADVA
jgi:L-aminopeptidase/D-esterase-like protein